MKIEKGIPLPNANSKYPFHEMEVGDSFFFVAENNARIRSAASIFGTRHNQKFSFRKVDDGFRCWRTE